MDKMDNISCLILFNCYKKLKLQQKQMWGHQTKTTAKLFQSLLWINTKPPQGMINAHKDTGASGSVPGCQMT